MRNIFKMQLLFITLFIFRHSDSPPQSVSLPLASLTLYYFPASLSGHHSCQGKAGWLVQEEDFNTDYT